MFGVGSQANCHTVPPQSTPHTVQRLDDPDGRPAKYFSWFVLTKRLVFTFVNLLISDSGLLGQDGRMAQATVEVDEDNLPLHVLQLPP